MLITLPPPPPSSRSILSFPPLSHRGHYPTLGRPSPGQRNPSRSSPSSPTRHPPRLTILEAATHRQSVYVVPAAVTPALSPSRATVRSSRRLQSIPSTSTACERRATAHAARTATTTKGRGPNLRASPFSSAAPAWHPSPVARASSCLSLIVIPGSPILQVRQARAVSPSPPPVGLQLIDSAFRLNL
ncbi:hypothetical protein K438DRAFT_1953457 [Mycena galopus ATCC 62051]|nr:hypothetical protein K438DRAFT_1972051 [Mycena galopus ATCC 62051]KAF8216532.1 hypothetical protein K438DRAFT_1953457 [Mycena galopus ATCC 62051]